MGKKYTVREHVSKIKNKLSIARVAFATGATSLMFTLAMPLAAHAASTVVVTPNNTQGWYSADTRTGGNINYVTDATSPYPDGALQLTTDATNAAKAQYLKDVNIPLSDVADLGYQTKQNSGPPVAAASYQVVVDLNGSETAGGTGTLVYEPYWNGTVVPTTWQSWDVDSGQFWSSQTFTDGSCSVVNGAGGPPFYTLSALKTACPNALVKSIGVNVGSYNPSYDVETDGVAFNGTTYNFELDKKATNKDQCKKNGWKDYGTTYKNQGDCVSSIVANPKSNR
jgi:hypothetical protein